MKTIITICAAAIMLTGCATHGTGASYAPLVDLRGADSTQYSQDLGSCQAYASQRAGAADMAVVGAIAGALIGVAFAAIGGGHGYRNEMAGIGALSGALSGAGQGEGTQRDIIRRCLAGRGYSVLD